MIKRWKPENRATAEKVMTDAVRDAVRKKPQTRASRWSSLVALVITVLVAGHTGNVMLGRAAGEAAGLLTETVMEAQTDGSAE